MINKYLTAIMLFLAMGYSVTASAHTGLSHASVMHSSLHIVATISVYLALMAVGFLVFKRLPKAIQQRVKK